MSEVFLFIFLFLLALFGCRENLSKFNFSQYPFVWYCNSFLSFFDQNCIGYSNYSLLCELFSFDFLRHQVIVNLIFAYSLFFTEAEKINVWPRKNLKMNFNYCCFLLKLLYLLLQVAGISQINLGITLITLDSRHCSRAKKFIISDTVVGVRLYEIILRLILDSWGERSFRVF